MKPTVGRIVHYTNLGDKDGKYPPEVQAALITKVTTAPYTEETPEEGRYAVTLHIFYPTGQFDRDLVPFTKAKAGTDEARGSWAWPEKA